MENVVINQDDLSMNSDDLSAPVETIGTAPETSAPMRFSVVVDVDGVGVVRWFELAAKYTLEIRSLVRILFRNAGIYLNELMPDRTSPTLIQDVVDYTCSRPELVRRAMKLAWVGNHGGIDWARDVDPEQVEEALALFFVSFNNAMSSTPS